MQYQQRVHIALARRHSILNPAKTRGKGGKQSMIYAHGERTLRFNLEMVIPGQGHSTWSGLLDHGQTVFRIA